MPIHKYDVLAFVVGTISPILLGALAGVVACVITDALGG